VNPQIASSGSVVLARITAPARRSLATISPSAVAGASNALVPNWVTIPSTSTMSLIATGTPSSGRSSPEARRPSAASASARARSSSTSVNAFTLGLRRSIRSR
jgi:hypothetical protein